MKWFDSEEIKDQTSLNADQIVYLKKPSFTVFGPFNVLVRKHWDFVIAGIIIRILDAIVISEESTSSYVLALIELAFLGWLFYFMIVNGRRLAWNRNKWADLNEFKKSETRWAPWGYIFFAITALILIGSFLRGFLGLEG